MTESESVEADPPPFQLSPTLITLVETADLVAKISALAAQSERVRVFNPVRAYMDLRRLRRAQRDLLGEYVETVGKLGDYPTGLQISSPMLTMGMATTQAGHQTLARLVQLQALWADLNATIDRQSSSALAWLSFYLGALSVLLGVLGVVLAL